MKIGLVHKRLDLNGGTERDLYKTAEGLRDLGHDVHLFCGEYRIAAPLGVTAHRIPALRLGRTIEMLSLSWQIARILNQVRCDLSVAFDRIPGCDVVRNGGGTHRGYLIRLAQARGVFGSLLQQLQPYHRTILMFEKRQLRSAKLKKIIAVSWEVKRDIMVHYDVADKQVSVLYNGVDGERFHPRRRAQSREAIRRRWKIPSGAPMVLFVGSGFRRKGLDRLLTIWNMPGLAKAYLLVVGSDARLSWYRGRAESIAPDRVIFAGQQEAIEDYYGAADIVALPSLQEAFGNVVLEALASGVPILVSRAAGGSELLTGRLTDGIVERPDDRVELSEKVIGLLDRANEDEMRQAARVLGETYSWERHFSALDALLREAREAPAGLVS